MPNAFAIFDSLYIIKQTKKQCSGLSVQELDFLSYFACLLSLYQGHPVTDWGYVYLRNVFGAPISADILEACQLLEKNSQLQRHDTVYNITERGEVRLTFYMDLDEFKFRKPYLDAACDCLLVESILDVLSTISKDAVILESSVHGLKYLNSTDNSALSVLYQQFEVIKKAIGNRSNLFIPATSWLLFLKENQEV